MTKHLKNGYEQKYMGLNPDGTEKWEYVHRLKAAAKKGEIVHHKDGNKGNQSKGNLEKLASRGRHNTVDPALHHGGRKKGK